MSDRTPGVQALACHVQFKFAEIDGQPLGAFQGYGAVFNNEDDGGDVILPGAFTATLAKYKASKTMPKMLLNHGGLANMYSDPSPEDLLPVGRWTDMSEDAHGLKVEGQLINLDTDHGKRVYGAMKEGAIDSMSIAYIPRDVIRGTKENEPRRQLKAVDLIEVGPVTFPANQLAKIGDVKSLRGLTPQDWRDLEGALRDEGLSRSDAVKAVSGFKSYLRRDGAGPILEPRDAATSEDASALVARIRALA